MSIVPSDPSSAFESIHITIDPPQEHRAEDHFQGHIAEMTPSKNSRPHFMELAFRNGLEICNFDPKVKLKIFDIIRDYFNEDLNMWIGSSSLRRSDTQHPLEDPPRLILGPSALGARQEDLPPLTLPRSVLPLVSSVLSYEDSDEENLPQESHPQDLLPQNPPPQNPLPQAVPIAPPRSEKICYCCTKPICHTLAVILAISAITVIVLNKNSVF